MRAAESTRAPGADDREGERRVLTVVFCDLVDSTPIAERLDPEDLRELVHRYREVAEASITRHGGRIAQYLGDGVLAYFGFPTAHEDDARRAVMAGLDISARIQELHEADLSARIAVHTGDVVVGRVRSADEGVSDELVGLAVNVAARLQGLAAPDSVIVSGSTAALVSGYVDLAPLGALPLKGVDEPIEAFRAQASHPDLTRFDLAIARGLTPLVGRTDDLAFLAERWRETRGGSTATLLRGDPGIGKTRLVREFRERLAGEPHDVVELQCAALHDNTQLHPVVQHLRSRLGGARSATAPGDRVEALRSLLRHAGVGDGPALDLVGALLDLPVPTAGADLPEGLELRRDLLLRYLRDVLVRSEPSRPLLLVVEDLQWADPTTLDLVASLPGEEPVRPVMVLCTARTGFTASWPGLVRHELARLDDAAARALVDWSTRRREGPPVDDRLAATIVERSDGVPLFLEEVTALLAARAAAGGGTPASAVPTSLRDLLVSRVDRLGDAKGLLQVAALIGRDFTLDLLAAVREEDPAASRAVLARPGVAELVVPVPGGRGDRFQFRHALVRDAAYSTLLLRRRRTLHALVGRLLVEDEERDVPRYGAAPEVIAYHCREGGLLEEAIDHLHRAATRAMSLAANAEAVAFLDSALDLLDTLPPGPERTSTTLVLLATKGPALMAQLGFAHADVAATFSAARDVLDELGDRTELFPVLYGLAAYSTVRCDLGTAAGLTARLRRSAEQARDDDLAMLAEAASAQTDFVAGAFPSAAAHAAACIDRHDPVRQAEFRLLLGEDPGTVCRGVACWLTWLRGDPAAAAAAMAATLATARSLDHAFTLAETLLIAARLHHYEGEVGAVRAVADEAAELAARHGFPLFAAEATVWQGWADVVEHGDRTGLQRAQAALAAWRSCGAEMFVPHHLTILGEAAWHLGDADEALTALSTARTRSDASGDRDHHVETLRVGAVVLAGQGGDAAGAEAEELLRRAAGLAARQDARSLAVRVAVSAVELAARSGSGRGRDESLLELAARLAELPDGATSPELDRARALTG